MPNVVNKMVVREMVSTLEGVEGMVMISMDGLTVVESEEIRCSLAEKGVRLRLVRNSLARLAFKEKGLDLSDDVFAGSVGVALGDAEQAIHAAKVFTGKEVKKAGKVKIRAGMLEGNMLGASDAQALANVPDSDTLKAMMLGCISGPARSLVGVLAANPSGLARLLQAKVDKGEG